MILINYKQLEDMVYFFTRTLTFRSILDHNNRVSSENLFEPICRYVPVVKKKWFPSEITDIE